uniref:RBR-type E3 ubiquitin transferase n=2 Tax=Parascaris univalens TaxID=6257 RepID=A0A915BYP9_PARUN
MPQYLDADVPMVRRRDCKDAKIYRKCFGNFGPNIISKYICAASQQTSVNNLLAEEKENKQKLSAHLMHQTDPFGIEDFNVPYSANKKQRWNFTDCADKRASTLQDQKHRVRVSLIRSKIMQRDRENDIGPEIYVAETPDSHILTNYYTFDEYSTIEKRGKRMTFASVSRKPNPPRHRRGRLIRNAAVSSSSEPSSEDKQDLSEDETVHIFYKEQCFDMTKREINMNKKMKREKNARVSQHRHSKRFPSDETEDAYGAVYDQLIHDCSFSPQEEDWRCYTDVNSPPLEPLQNFIVTTKKVCKGKRKRRRSEPDDSDINEHKAIVIIEDDNLSQSSSNDAVLLPTITLSSLYGSFCSVVESEFPNARKVDRFQPSTYAVRIGGESYEMLESVLPEGFVGTVFVQDAGPSQDNYLLRCILNESELSRSLMERRLGNELTNNLNSESQSVALTPLGHLPKSAFVDREVYTQTTAAFQALSDLSSKASRCDVVISSPTDVISCGVCCVEDEPCMSLACSHYFCQRCWASYILSCLHNARVPITCPEYGCEHILELDHMMTMMPATHCVNYAKMMLRDLLTAPENFLCIRCSSVIHIANSYPNRKIVECICGCVMCLQCKRPLHAPLDCAAAKQYNSIREINGHINPSVNDDVEIVVKQCPSCKNFCQRSTGCDHMNCPCGIEFCYRCGGLWLEKEHGTCEEQHFEKVLHDEPQVFSGNFSLRVFRRCQMMRSFIREDNLLPIRAMFYHISLPVPEKKRLLQCYVELCQLMEVTTVKQHIEERRLRSFKSLKVNLNATNDRGDVLLKFLKTALELASSDHQNPKAKSRFLTIIRKVDSTIASYMSRYFPV